GFVPCASSGFRIGSGLGAHAAFLRSSCGIACRNCVGIGWLTLMPRRAHRRRKWGKGGGPQWTVATEKGGDSVSSPEPVGGGPGRKVLPFVNICSRSAASGE